MTKERISSAELAQRKEEYYELLATSDSSLREVLNQRGGLVLARVGRYQPWPARFCEPGEFAKMARYRAKKGQACVYFFGSRNYGWVSKSSIQPFPEDLTTLTGSAKYNQALIQEALDEAKFVLDVTDETGRRFFDRIMERKEEAVDLPCERCNRVDDHYSLLILCDGKNCKREYHMNCLSPPLESIPPGDWFCPDCEKDQEKEREKEREKEQLKRAKAEAMDKQDASVTEVNAVDGELPVAKTPSAKKVVKKHKLKSRDGTAKRRLASTSPDRVGVSVKKPRAGRSSSREVSPPPRTTPKRLDGRKKKPSQLSIPSSRAQLLSDPESGTADDEQQSEEKCLLCGFGGELIVCEFPACTKVYHQFCLGAYPFPKDEDATWYCPRHTCVLTGEKELCEDGEKTTNKLKHASPRKVNVKNVLWKCNQCPLAIAEEALPQLPQGQIFSKKSRTFMCPNCYLNAPAKVQLAKRLEKIWSTLATNRQGMPFCGPLLCGVEPVDGQSEDTRTQLDLFKVLARIRRLEYSESAGFSRDIDEVVANALDLIANRSFPLMEAAKTLKIIRNEQFAIHQQKLDFLDTKIRRLQTDGENGRDDDDNLADADKKKWPLRWRQECGPFEDKYYALLDAKSLEEWAALVSAAPLYASGDELDARSAVGADMSDELSGGEDETQQRSRSPSLGSANELSGPPAATRVESGLSLSEGTDVMIAFGDLSKPGCGTQKRRFGGEQTKELDSMDTREFFLSPSTSEMQHMFDQQSTLLRSALEAHSTLQRSWLISQQDMLGLGGRGGFSVGEGRLAAELRLANKNLRQRLRNKDKLVDQLTSDHMALRAEVINLQRELSQSKIRARELEEQIATAGSINQGRPDDAHAGNSKTVVSNGEMAATPDRSTDEEHMFS
ncbi:hypothetical protein PHYSODRAFT_551242 [Phytophthora sojae]|uniref:PHD-type domain-containing protein n=1 Tax=Phytophthora sojae (strain P6497) TaxID=1094619 RepID=G5AF22_PHYSP|nr:hypothetical protein PHYSODRAFT_551242 [Phytophthora sojae]EGZ05812.1 hypothetical protein PHYSODRAFT_551242 [Phytophthora sojae]|eukprot:XP_009538673.1 hypothetical protein PHYSODRAFT_551242 [Phytophthora sojae]